MTIPRVTVPVEPTEAMRLVPDRVLTETLYWMARAYERVHSMPRVSDTELANKIEAAKADLGRARDASPVLTNSAAPAPEGGSVDGWRPIDSAPQDGTKIDLWGHWPEHDRWTRTPDAVWDEERCDWKVNGFYAGQYAHPPHFTHWRAISGPAALATREEAPVETKEQLAKRLIGEAVAEEAARNKLIGLIEQWDGESEYDAEDVAALADDILHAFNGPPFESEEAPADTTDCKRCAGNGEIITDWDEYLSPPKGAPADHATADCPDCDGIGKVEAPAEAGEDDVRGLIGEAIQGLERAIASTRFDGASKEVFAACVDDFRKVLRAQPQAREDAQPVGWTGSGSIDALKAGMEGHIWPTKAAAHPVALYTRPAHDALRVAVEKIKNLPTSQLHKARVIAWEALAALQAEQKGGAA